MSTSTSSCTTPTRWSPQYGRRGWWTWSGTSAGRWRGRSRPSGSTCWDGARTDPSEPSLHLQRPLDVAEAEEVVDGVHRGVDAGDDGEDVAAVGVALTDRSQVDQLEGEPEPMTAMSRQHEGAALQRAPGGDLVDEQLRGRHARPVGGVREHAELPAPGGQEARV